MYELLLCLLVSYILCLLAILGFFEKSQLSSEILTIIFFSLLTVLL